MAEKGLTKTIGDVLGGVLAKPLHKLSEWGAKSRVNSVVATVTLVRLGALGSYYLGPDNSVTHEADAAREELVVVDPSGTAIVPPATIEK